MARTKKWNTRNVKHTVNSPLQLQETLDCFFCFRRHLQSRPASTFFRYILDLQIDIPMPLFNESRSSMKFQTFLPIPSKSSQNTFISLPLLVFCFEACRDEASWAQSGCQRGELPSQGRLPFFRHWTSDVIDRLPWIDLFFDSKIQLRSILLTVLTRGRGGSGGPGLGREVLQPDGKGELSERQKRWWLE